MSTRAYAGRAPRRRPAARKRRPAARSAPSRIKWDRVGRIALTLVLAAVLYSYLNPAIDFVKTYTATTAAKVQLHELQRENRQLHNRVHSAKDPLVIDREARGQGMVAEGETPIVIRGLNR
jgi:cell division protein FtsB